MSGETRDASGSFAVRESPDPELQAERALELRWRMLDAAARAALAGDEIGDGARRRVAETLSVLRAAAEQGRICPGNGEIAQALGLAGAGAVDRSIAYLQARGILRVEFAGREGPGGKQRRRVVFVRDGLGTAWSQSALAWLEKREARRREMERIEAGGGLDGGDGRETGHAARLQWRARAARLIAKGFTPTA